MASIAESGTQEQLAAALKQGQNQLVEFDSITFTLYTRVVLPLDGYVFWVRADTLRPGALLNAMRFNAAAFGQPSAVTVPALTATAQGVLHYSVARQQLADEILDVQRVIFDSQIKLDIFGLVGPQSMLVADINGYPFAFTRQGDYLPQADIWHYQGDALYPALQGQVLNSIPLLDTADLIVTNSLPIWLLQNSACPMYPAYMLPANLPPPYGVVDVLETEALASAPLIDAQDNDWQLCRDRVRVTFYGLRNAAAQDWRDAVFAYSLAADTLGIMNMPIIKDEKRAQAEFATLALKKSVEFEVSYYQARARNVAMQLIEEAFLTVNIGSASLALTL